MQAQPSDIGVATGDILASLCRYRLPAMLGWQDIRQRYRRSTLGPFWLTISMGVMIGALALVFGHLFQTPMEEFLPFLCVGLILWTYIAAVVTEGCASFIAAEGIIKQLPIPLFVHVARVYWRNTVIFAHNLAIFPLVLLAVGKPLTWTALLSIPGLLLVSLNLLWAALVLGILCARYRDLPQIVGSLMQVAFYMTPIIWVPHLLPERVSLYLLNFNPFYHFLQVVRAPLLGEIPGALSWGAAAGIAVAGWSFALLFFSRFRKRIPYWL